MNKNEVVNKFISYVKIDSESLKEKKLVQLLVKDFKKIGANKIIVDNADKKVNGKIGNLIIKFAGTNQLKEPIIICAHLDTVKPGVNIKPKIKGDIIESDKTTILGADDKAAITAIYFAIKEIKEKKLEHPPIEIVFTIAEEIGLLGSKNFDYKLLSGKKAYIFDADGKIGTLIVKSPTHIRYEVKIKGRAAHAGIFPEKGKNAIKVASEIITKIKTGKLDDNTTANIGIINGGLATNIVPDNVVFNGEVRSHNDETLRNYVNELKEIIKNVCIKYKVKYELQINKEYEKMSVNDNSLLIQNFKKSLEGISRNFKLEKTMGGSDASIFNQNGIEAVNVAIEFIDIHSTNEKYKISSLMKLIKLVMNLIINWK